MSISWKVTPQLEPGVHRIIGVTPPGRPTRYVVSEPPSAHQVARSPYCQSGGTRTVTPCQVSQRPGNLSTGFSVDVSSATGVLSVLSPPSPPRATTASGIARAAIAPAPT